MKKQVIIFLKDGKPLLFEEVCNLEVHEEYIAFAYYVSSTKHGKSAAFYVGNIAGWSISEGLL
ncbi:hypothetical protein ML603_08300 [Streptococcus dysgalactiae subsp. equisimilis]|uniref:hypothetical protein n=1 Tax=Streptococcus dysgalactiae TaxID=1334 RepID=UPI001F132B8C|nr:hypothetical protein [Streptococcus dysgalactiae]MCL6222239.1 hypothetical protein [Streptococcus dysgalactiae subsp. equisimilis]UMY67871.1 hypothetical protein ML603_08300 [Streptococcus dysgalactiae subsp. equisimilis]